MDLKIIILMLCGGATVAGVLFMLVKQMANKVATAGKKPLLLLLGAALITAIIATGILYLVGGGSFIQYWMLATLFVISGFIFYRLSHKRFISLEEDEQAKLSLAEMLYSFAAMLLSVAGLAAGALFLIDRGFDLYPTLLSGLFFMLPLCLALLHGATLSIPAAQFPVWQYPAQPLDLPDEVDGEKLLVIGFEIAKKPADFQKTHFRAKAPESMQLGELYYHFLQDYNDAHSETPIHIAGTGKPSSWWFWLKPKWYQRARMLAPDEIIRNSRIRENAVIMCERMPDAA